MVQRNCSMGEDEPKSFLKPSEGEHLLAVAEVFDETNDPYGLGLGPDDVSVKFEVAAGPELGRTLLHRMNINPDWPGFFVVRKFLKSVGLPYKGDVLVDSDEWQGCQCYATVIHKKADNGKTYANIDDYNYEKIVEQVDTKPDTAKPVDEEVKAWDSE